MHLLSTLLKKQILFTSTKYSEEPSVPTFASPDVLKRYQFTNKVMSTNISIIVKKKTKPSKNYKATESQKNRTRSGKDSKGNRIHVNMNKIPEAILNIELA